MSEDHLDQQVTDPLSSIIVPWPMVGVLPGLCLARSAELLMLLQAWVVPLTVVPYGFQ